MSRAENENCNFLIIRRTHSLHHGVLMCVPHAHTGRHTEAKLLQDTQCRQPSLSPGRKWAGMGDHDPLAAGWNQEVNLFLSPFRQWGQSIPPPQQFKGSGSPLASSDGKSGLQGQCLVSASPSTERTAAALPRSVNRRSGACREGF